MSGEKGVERTKGVDEPDRNDGVYVVTQQIRSQGSDSDLSDSSHLKTTRDGKTVLIPQPTESPDDPLNWSWMKKHAVFLAILPGCFLTDWVITWGTTLFEAQAHDWHVSSYDGNSNSPPC